MESKNSELITREQTQFLTGIRGYAALAVVMVHCTGFLKGGHEPVDNLLNFGKYGVVIFFVLSAFSLAISMNLNPLTSRQRVTHYLSRRFWRIFPLYVLVCSGCALALHTDAGSLTDLFMHVTLLNVFNHKYANSLIGVEWTIPLEMFAYLLLPLLLVITKRQKWRWGILTILVLYVVGKQGNTFEKLLPDGQTFYNHEWSILKYLFAFYAGVLAFNRLGSFRFSLKTKTYDFVVVGLVAFMVPFAMFFPTSEALVVTLWTTILIYALLKASSHVRWMFENKVILQIGKISFSVYLLHMPLFKWLSPRLESQWGGAGSFVIFLVVLMVLSSLAYRLIEAPCIRFGEQWFMRLTTMKEVEKVTI